MVLRKTKAVFYWNRLLSAPFWAIYAVLAVVLHKAEHISPAQLTLVVASKPAASILGFFWAGLVNRRRDRLVANLVWANMLKFMPFLFFPFISNSWFFISSIALFMVFQRGVIPAWMEVIKLSIKGSERESTFAVGAAIDYVISTLIPFVFGWMLDEHQSSWRWISAGTALLGMSSTFFLCRLSLGPIVRASSYLPSSSYRTSLAEAWSLLRERPDFAQFQMGFMLGGSGLIIFQTALPVFFVETLHLSYTELCAALMVCKALGFALTSTTWAKRLNSVDIFRMCALVTSLAALFPLLLLCATWQISWLYIAYGIYGVMQAGSELCWHMSGPLFSGEQESSSYSAINVLSVGIRGCVVPFIGTLLYVFLGIHVVFIAGSLLCLLATLHMRRFSLQTVPGALVLES